MSPTDGPRFRVLALNGSLRQRSSNGALLRAAAALAPEDVQVTFCDPWSALPAFNPDLDLEGTPPLPAVHAFRQVLTGADALLLSSPEYAHGIPGSLKNALDWIVSSGELMGKPIFLLNASAHGGQFAQAALKEVLTVMSARVLDASLSEPFVPRGAAAGDLGSPEVQEKLRGCWRALKQALAGDLPP